MSDRTDAIRNHVRHVAERVEDLEDDDAPGWTDVADRLGAAHGHAVDHAGATKTKQAVERDFNASGRMRDDQI